MTNGKISLKVNKRDILGKKSKQLRQQGLVLGNVVIPGEKSLPIAVDATQMKKIYDQAGESTLIYLTLGEEKTERPVLIKDVEFHPTRHSLFHVSLLQVNLNEEVEAAVPIEYQGEFAGDGGVLLKLKDSIDVSALPANLPESFVIDLSTLKEVDQSITLADIKIDPTKVKFVLSADTKPEDVVLVLVQEERVEEPEAEPEVEVVEGVPATPGTAEGGEKSAEEPKQPA